MRSTSLTPLPLQALAPLADGPARAEVAPREVALRAKLAHLVAEKAAAESMLFFGPGSFRLRAEGHTLAVKGALETDVAYTFSADYHAVTVTRGPAAELAEQVALANPVEDFRRLLAADILVALLHCAARRQPGEALDVSGVETAADGVLRCSLTGPGGVVLTVAYNPATGGLALREAGASEEVFCPVGRRLTTLVRALDVWLKLELPLEG